MEFTMEWQRDHTTASAAAMGSQPARQPETMRFDAPDRLASAPHVQVSDLNRELASYLDLGYDVHSASDGWALLNCGEKSFVLVQASLPAAASAPSPMRLIRSPGVVAKSAEIAGDHGRAAAFAGIGGAEELAC